MKAIIKKPNEQAEIIEIDNTLKSLQEAVGGYIETVTLAKDCCIICNEEGRLQGLPYNLNFCGITLVGTILFVGVSGDEFTCLSEQQAEFILRNLNKVRGGK